LQAYRLSTDPRNNETIHSACARDLPPKVQHWVAPQSDHSAVALPPPVDGRDLLRVLKQNQNLGSPDSSSGA
jgi:hypothetical protein